MYSKMAMNIELTKQQNIINMINKIFKLTIVINITGAIILLFKFLITIPFLNYEGAPFLELFSYLTFNLFLVIYLLWLIMVLFKEKTEYYINKIIYFKLFSSFFIILSPIVYYKINFGPIIELFYNLDENSISSHIKIWENTFVVILNNQDINKDILGINIVAIFELYILFKMRKKLLLNPSL